MKDCENRVWRRNYAGPVLIHAGVGFDHEAVPDPGLAERLAGTEMPRGGIVGACRVTGCVAASDSPWFFGPYAFTLAHARPLPFVPMRGALGFFRPTPEVLAAVLPHLIGWLGWDG